MDTKHASLPVAAIALMRPDVEGLFVKVEPPKWAICRACRGRGWIGEARCGECDGTGEATTFRPICLHEFGIDNKCYMCGALKVMVMARAMVGK